MVGCPNCGRPIASVNFTKCLYCGASLDEALLKSIEPPDYKQIEAMLTIHRDADEAMKARGLMVARLLYGTLSLLILVAGMGLTFYGLKKGPGGSGLAILIGFAALGVLTFTIYKTIRPQPGTVAKRTESSSHRW